MLSFFKSGLVWAGILLSLTAYGQQTTNLPLGALPMQYNGSFAGEAGSPRISTNFGLITGRGTYGRGYHLTASYDQFIPALRSGIGATVFSSHAASPLYKFNRQGLSVAVAPKISLGGKWTFSPSLDLTYDRGRLPFSNSMINDSLIPSYGYDIEQWQSRAGFLLNTSKFYVGYSVAVVDHRRVNFTNGDRLRGRPTRFSSYLQLGYTFQKSPESNFSFTPQLTFYIGGDQVFLYNWVDDRIKVNYFYAFNLNFRYKQFIWGVNNMGFHVGWQSQRVKVMASSSIGVAGKHIDPGYTGNVSLRYLFKD
jgi:hypothetical protein